ncbi:hypothetical protein VLI49_001637 [Enterobacter kobei]|nr:hypothetical protein [Enterobacter kobei]
MINRAKLEHILEYAKQQRHIGMHCKVPPEDMVEIVEMAMLQGAEPVTTACKSPELTDAQCLEFLAVAFRHARIKGDIEFDDIRLSLKLALEAAPQQEVK